MSIVREAWTDERLDDLQAGMHREFDQVRTEMDRRFEAVDRRFDDVDKRFDKIEAQLDRMIGQLDAFVRISFVGAVSLFGTVFGAVAARVLF